VLHWQRELCLRGGATSHRDVSGTWRNDAGLLSSLRGRAGWPRGAWAVPALPVWAMILGLGVVRGSGRLLWPCHAPRLARTCACACCALVWTRRP